MGQVFFAEMTCGLILVPARPLEQENTSIPGMGYKSPGGRKAAGAVAGIGVLVNLQFGIRVTEIMCRIVARLFYTGISGCDSFQRRMPGIA